MSACRPRKDRILQTLPLRRSTRVVFIALEDVAGVLGRLHEEEHDRKFRRVRRGGTYQGAYDAEYAEFDRNSVEGEAQARERDFPQRCQAVDSTQKRYIRPIFCAKDSTSANLQCES